MTDKTNIDDAVCRHCGKVIGTVPKHYCPRSPNQTHEPVEPPTETITVETCECCGKPLSECEQEKADIWNHNHQEPAPTVQTITLTPRGAETPEGIQRINAAMKEFEDATAAVANAATQFFDDHRITLVEVARGISIAEDDRKALGEDLRQLDPLIDARRRKQEEFLRSVAGAPPAPSYEDILKPRIR